MHFRRCVALVIWEYVANHYKLAATEVARHHITTYIDALDGLAEFVRCIYHALCGVEPHTHKAERTVLWWVRHPESMIRVRR